MSNSTAAVSSARAVDRVANSFPPESGCDMTAGSLTDFDPQRQRNSVNRRIDLRTTFYQACQQAGMQQKEVASLMGVREQQLSAMLSQDRPLSIVRLIALKEFPDGRRFLRCYWPLIGAAMGLPEFAHGLKVADALVDFISATQKRVAYVELEEIERRRPDPGPICWGDKESA